MPTYRQYAPGQKPKGADKGKLHRLKQGGIAPNLDIYEAILKKTHDTYQAINRRRVIDAFIDSGTGLGMGAPFVTKMDVPTRTKLELLAEKVEDGDLTVEMAEALEANDAITADMLNNSALASKPSSDSQYKLFTRGFGKEAEHYKIDPDVWRVISNFNSARASALNGALLTTVQKFGIVSDFSKLMMVGVNLPYYTGKNAFLDLKNSLLSGLYDVRKEESKTGVFFGSLRQMATGVRSQISGEQSDVDRLYGSVGGDRLTQLRTSDQISGRGGLKKVRAKIYRRTTFGKPRSLSVGEQFETALVSMMNFAERVNNVIEQAPRKAAFITTLQNIAAHTNEFSVNKDGSIDGEVPQYAAVRAMNNAMEMGPNYARYGDLAPVLENLFPFASSTMAATYTQMLRLQQAGKTARAGDPRQAKRMAIYGVAALSSLALRYFYMMNAEDDEGPYAAAPED
jgi:hypothetical protein